MIYRIELDGEAAVLMANLFFGESVPCTDATGRTRLVRVRGAAGEHASFGSVRIRCAGHVDDRDEIPDYPWEALLPMAQLVAAFAMAVSNWRDDLVQELYSVGLDRALGPERARQAVTEAARVAGSRAEVTADAPDSRDALKAIGVPEAWLSARLPEPELLELNAEYAYVKDEGEVLRTYDGRAVMMSVTSFKNALRNRKIEWSERQPQGAAKVRSMPLAEWWMQHPLRRTYDRREFLPGTHAPRGVYNTWPGYGVHARQGDCSRFKALVRDVVCCGNITHYRYLWGWMANAVQNPGEPGQVAIVLHGGQGTGKGTFAKYFGRLFGRCFMPIGNAARITGQFTGHLHDKVVVFVDEAVFAEDKKARSLLKFLTTEEELDGRAMFREAEQVRNCLHLVLGSNEEHVLDVSPDDRRYFVLRVSDEHAKDAHYFGGIAEELRGGGPEALLHELLQEDLSGFDVRARPETRALDAQKEHSLSPMEQWLFELLRVGVLPATTWPRFPRRSDRAELLGDMRRSAGTTLNGKTDASLCRFLQRWGANTDVKAVGPGGRYVEMPELRAIRSAWAKVFPSPDWDLSEEWTGAVPY